MIGEDGIIAKAEQAKIAQILGEYKDKIEIAKATVAMDEDNLGKVPLAALKEELERMGMTVTETGKGENAKLEVTVPGTTEKIEITNFETTNVVIGNGMNLIVEKSKLGIGQTTTLVAIIGENETNDVEWESNNEEIATVDENGKVTGIGKDAGKATITAKSKTDTSVYVSCNIQVELKIYDAEGMRQFSSNTVSDETIGKEATDYAGKTISIVAKENEIDLEENWTRGGTFGGTLEGNNHLISGTTDTLVEIIANTGRIKNLNINAAIKSDVELIGMICSTNLGIIEKCTTLGSMEAKDCGGICHTNMGVIYQCINHAELYSNGTGAGGIAVVNRKV